MMECHAEAESEASAAHIATSELTEEVAPLASALWAATKKR